MKIPVKVNIMEKLINIPVCNHHQFVNALIITEHGIQKTPGRSVKCRVEGCTNRTNTSLRMTPKTMEEFK